MTRSNFKDPTDTPHQSRSQFLDSELIAYIGGLWVRHLKKKKERKKEILDFQCSANSQELLPALNKH